MRRRRRRANSRDTSGGRRSRRSGSPGAARARALPSRRPLPLPSRPFPVPSTGTAAAAASHRFPPRRLPFLPPAPPPRSPPRRRNRRLRHHPQPSARCASVIDHSTKHSVGIVRKLGVCVAIGHEKAQREPPAILQGNCEPQIVSSQHTYQRDLLTGPPWCLAWKIHVKWERVSCEHLRWCGLVIKENKTVQTDGEFKRRSASPREVHRVTAEDTDGACSMSSSYNIMPALTTSSQGEL